MLTPESIYRLMDLESQIQFSDAYLWLTWVRNPGVRRMGFTTRMIIEAIQLNSRVEGVEIIIVASSRNLVSGLINDIKTLLLKMQAMELLPVYEDSGFPNKWIFLTSSEFRDRVSGIPDSAVVFLDNSCWPHFPVPSTPLWLARNQNEALDVFGTAVVRTNFAEGKAIQRIGEKIADDEWEVAYIRGDKLDISDFPG